MGMIIPFSVQSSFANDKPTRYLLTRVKRRIAAQVRILRIKNGDEEKDSLELLLLSYPSCHVSLLLPMIPVGEDYMM